MNRPSSRRLIGPLTLLALGASLIAGPVSRAAPAGAAWGAAWPMVGHDPQQTGRSPNRGPRDPRLLWTYHGLGAPVIIGPDSTVYGWTTRGLTAIDAAGKTRWIVPAQEYFGGPPALGSDGLLRVSGDLSETGRTPTRFRPIVALFAVSPQGKSVWAVRSLPWATVPESVPFSKGASPIVSAANLFYVPFVGPSYSATQNNGVEMISPSGVPLRRLFAGFGGPLAVAPNGTIYQLGYNYAGQMAVLAARPDGTALWRQTLSYGQDGSIMVGRGGTVYVSDGAGWGPHDMGEVVAYTPAGRLVWRRTIHTGIPSLAERPDGTLLAANSGGLSAISPSGVLLWRATIGRPPATPYASPSLAVDAAGYAYVGSADGQISAITPSGTRTWTLHAGSPSQRGDVPSVALGPNGVLVVVGTDGILRLFR